MSHQHLPGKYSKHQTPTSKQTHTNVDELSSFCCFLMEHYRARGNLRWFMKKAKKFLLSIDFLEHGKCSWSKRGNSPMKSNASWKYCLMFWCGVSLAGICLYLTPGLFCVVDGWQVTLRTQLAPTLDGSVASRPLPSSRWGNTGDAGCVSISEKT